MGKQSRIDTASAITLHPPKPAQLVAADCRQQERRVADVAGDGTDMGERGGRRGRPNRHAPELRLDAGEAGETARNAHRAATVRAKREWRDAGGDRGCRACARGNWWPSRKWKRRDAPSSNVSARHNSATRSIAAVASPMNRNDRQRFVGWVMKLKRGGSGRSKPTIMSGGPSSPPSLL